MTAEFASDWLSWQPSELSETSSQRGAISAISPPLISENIDHHNHNDPSGTYGTLLTRHIQKFECPENSRSWQDGHARLKAMDRPHGYPAGPWQQLIANSEIFLREWAEEAVRLGWDSYDLYGIDRLAPYHRLDRAGLLLLVGDHRISGLEKDSATLRTATGALQTYRRVDRGANPIVLVWEPAGSRADEERVDREERAAIQEFDG